MNPSPAIRFVYFDLGNVLVRFDPERGCRNLAEWAGVTPAAVDKAIWASGLEEDFECGRVAPAAFAQRVAEALRVPVGRLDEQGQPLLDLVSNMFTPLAEMLPVIERLREAGVGLGILSNTCHAHWDWISRQGWPVCSGWSTADVLSYEVGQMKPAAEIYAVAQRRAGVPAEQIFFTDDRPENVAGALAAGWQAEVFRGAEELSTQLQRILPSRSRDFRNSPNV
ncbi:HAD family hydrolase [Roseimaritima ulvae]|uniref:Alpha-D-glucose-1-phosphate phosphatase YihX n=1 Tax=Roseimaritima ulvae TaxID=980254 RepID=A0A5B9R943_9BACT|nr:HAD family phosphatase [Roseimaritima ulvae]QEG43283.1 Alpha-D-glucose-1-phosphate phosphatase YihX [Roseimaritima ulvae]